METTNNTRENESSKDRMSNRVLTQVIGGLILALIVAIVSLAFNFNERITRLEEKVTNVKENLDEISKNAVPIKSSDSIKINTISTTNPISTTKKDPSKLVDVIKEQQKQNVRQSYNEYDCFTDDNFNSFKKDRKQDQIVSDLMNDNSFIDLIISIKEMSLTVSTPSLPRVSSRVVCRFITCFLSLRLNHLIQSGGSGGLTCYFLSGKLHTSC